MKKYLRCFKENTDITVGNRYEIVGETMCLGDMCYVIIDDAGDRNHWPIEVDRDGESYRNWFTLETDEQSRKIDGRKAEIISPGERYQTYRGFAKKHGYPDAAAKDHRLDRRKRLSEGDIVTLLVSGKHGGTGATLWIVESANGERHIYNEKGLRILSEEVANITVLKDESLGGVQHEYRDAKRKATVGERIKVIAVSPDSMKVGDVQIGDVYTVQDVDRSGDVWKVLERGFRGIISENWHGFGREYVVLEPTDIIRIDNERLRMVDRKAAVGERVVVVNIRYKRDRNETLAVGQIGECTQDDEFEDASVDTTLTHDDSGFLNADRVEYRVLEPVSVDVERSAHPTPLSAQPAVNQAAATIATLTAKVQKLETQLRVAREDIVLIEEGVADDIARLTDRLSALEKANLPVKVAEGQADDARPSFAKRCQTLQQIRDEIVERAQADVKALLDRNYYIGYSPTIWFTNKDGSYITDKCEFIINRDKRTVVALISTVRGGEPFRKGIAKCAPNDVFNAHIGRAIALRRALGLEVPAEYLNVPNPEEPRVGDVIEKLQGAFAGAKGIVNAVRPTGYLDYQNGLTFVDKSAHKDVIWAYIQHVRILDDSREEVGA